MKKMILLFIILILLIALPYHYLSLSLINPLKEYGKMEVERLNQLILNHARFTEEKQYDQLIILERNNQNEIIFIDFDMIEVNKIASDVVLDIEETYAYIENGQYQQKDDSYYEKRIAEVSKSGIVSKVSIGTLLNMPLLSKITPYLSVRYKHLTSISSNIEKEIKNYGLNSIMVELTIQLSIKLLMVYPFFEEYHELQVDIPLLLEIIEGQLPLVYNERKE